MAHRTYSATRTVKFIWRDTVSIPVFKKISSQGFGDSALSRAHQIVSWHTDSYFQYKDLLLLSLGFWLYSAAILFILKRD